MTREEAIKWFKDSAFYHKDHEPFNMAISALEQKPCEDAVSREAVFDIVCRETEWYDIKTQIEQLPSVTRQTGEWISIDDYHIGKFKCSICQTEGFPNTSMYKPTWNFCPNCGCRMESEE